MATASRPDLFPTSSLDELPTPLRAALLRQGRAVRALRVYRRRGWNESAARLECARASEQVQQLLAELEHSEQNPGLF